MNTTGYTTPESACWELTVLGIGDAFSARHYNTCFLLRGSQSILVDGSPGLFRLLRERRIERPAIDSVLLTHVHEDHSGGIETLLVWRRYVLGRRTRLMTSLRVYREIESSFFPRFALAFSEDLKSVRRAPLSEFVDFQDLSEDGVNLIGEGMGVEIRHNWHPTATLGLKLHLGSRSVGLSGDTCYRPTLLAQLHREGRITRPEYERLDGPWLWEADLIYHEATDVPDTAHTCLAHLAALPVQWRDKIRLVHVSDDFVPGRMTVAREGEVVQVNAGGVMRLSEPTA